MSVSPASGLRVQAAHASRTRVTQLTAGPVYACFVTRYVTNDIVPAFRLVQHNQSSCSELDGTPARYDRTCGPGLGNALTSSGLHLPSTCIVAHFITHIKRIQARKMCCPRLPKSEIGFRTFKSYYAIPLFCSLHFFKAASHLHNTRTRTRIHTQERMR